MLRTLLPVSLLLLVPNIGHAQDPLPNVMADHAYFGPIWFASATDSAAFSNFRNGLRTVQPTGTQDTTMVVPHAVAGRSTRWPLVGEPRGQ